jgi:SAM-dependent methyltransferase
MAESRASSVSGAWVAQTEADPSYFSVPRAIGKDFFRRVLRSRWVASLLGDPAYKTFLEAGCFIGRFGIAAATTGKKVTLMDCSPQSLRDAERLKAIAEKEFGRLDVAFVEDDLERMRFAGGSFDVTFNEGVLEHWLDRNDRVRIIKEMARVTRPGGLVSVRVINNKNRLYQTVIALVARTALPHYAYSLSELEGEMREAGLEITAADGDTMNDPAHWMKNRGWAGIFFGVSVILSRLPRPLRRVLCPSIYCNGMVGTAAKAGAHA